MTERELGRALLDLDVAPPPAAPDPRQLMRRILDRDRRRVRRLAVLATFFWVLTAAEVICACPFYVMNVAPRLRAYHAGRAQLARDWDAWARVGEWAAYWLVACILSLLVAALCTVLLVLLSRRATLRQINANLAAISEQLRAAGAARPTDVPAGGHGNAGTVP